MADDRDGWIRLAPVGFRAELSYPAMTPSGHAVDRDDERIEGHPIAGDVARVHLRSRDSQELYVELGLFRSRTPQDEYDQHRPSLERRFGAQAVTPLTETRVGDRIAWTYSFRWDEGERVVLLLYAEPDTYRVVYDPRSSLSGDVLATLTILE